MENRKVVFLGDIHGGFHKVLNYVNRNKLTDIDIVQVGDFGVGFHPLPLEHRSLQEINAHLASSNVMLYAIRGNHDDPELFEDDPFDLTNIKLIPDYTILELGDRKIFCVGGALSIDRIPRKINGWGYWEDEGFVFDKDKIDSMDLSEVNTIVTHSSPKFCYPTHFSQIVYDFANQDAGLIRDLEVERDLITDFYEYIKPTMPKLEEYYYGHFHWHKQEEFDGVKFRLLDIDEFA